ncbi:hypothetical protein R0V13_01340 [Facklamia hominis]|uniref:hypothetical protein n=1 Tax=Facklamia hominis TaxID=178214 RepID=UPI0029D40FB5|nr:hypothetical protein [Facklamia hominis]WPJ91061.1 hypothetical protein R0V13_01340 [Facklamia hominis]
MANHLYVLVDRNSKTIKHWAKTRANLNRWLLKTYLRPQKRQADSDIFEMGFEAMIYRVAFRKDQEEIYKEKLRKAEE